MLLFTARSGPAFQSISRRSALRDTGLHVAAYRGRKIRRHYAFDDDSAIGLAISAQKKGSSPVSLDKWGNQSDRSLTDEALHGSSAIFDRHSGAIKRQQTAALPGILATAGEFTKVAGIKVATKRNTGWFHRLPVHLCATLNAAARPMLAVLPPRIMPRVMIPLAPGWNGSPVEADEEYELFEVWDAVVSPRRHNYELA